MIILSYVYLFNSFINHTDILSEKFNIFGYYLLGEERVKKF